MPTPPEPQPLAPFDASRNIRDSITNLDDDALRASLKEFGWKRHLPAFVDENNLVLVGHRRMRIAAELGIDPVVVKLELGTGTAAENERRIIATTANIGFAEMSIASRRKLAVQFCQQGMTQTAVAAMLGVSQATISGDLAALSTADNTPKPVTDKLGRKNTGRRGSGTKASKPEIRDTEAVDDDEPHLSVAAKLARLPDDERQQVLRGLPRMSGSSSSYGPTLTGKGKRIALERIAAIEASKAKADTKPADKPRVVITPLAAGARSTAAAPPSSQEIDRHKLKLEYEYEVRARKLENEYIARMEKQARDSVTVQVSDDVQTEVNRWLELLLPELHKERAKARRTVAKRKRIISKAAFNKLMFAVHPDTGGHATAKDRDAATRTLNALKPYVVDEAGEPTQWDSDLPNDLAGWAKCLQDAELKRRMSDIPRMRFMPLPPFLEPKETVPPKRDAAKAKRDAATPKPSTN